MHVCLSACGVFVCVGVHLISTGIPAPSVTPERRGMEIEEKGRQIEALSLV